MSGIVKTTIIVPCYNSSSYLEECIHSIKRQTIQDFKCIIIDDCSTDNTIQIAEKLVNDDPRFQIVSNQENLGPYGNLNKAINLVNTEFFTRVDSDDYIDTQYLQKGLDIISANSELAAVFTNFRFFPIKRPDTKYNEAFENRSFSFNEVIDKIGLSHDGSFFKNSLNRFFRGIVLIRKSHFDKTGAFKNWKSESDTLKWIELATEFKVYCISSPLYSYRQHNQSVTSGAVKSNEDLKCKKKMLSFLLDYLMRKNILSQQTGNNQKNIMLREYKGHMLYRFRKSKNVMSFLKLLFTPSQKI